MKRIAIAFAVIGLLAFCRSGQTAEPTPATQPASQPTDVIVPTQRIELFNGKDLSGWKSFLLRNTPADGVWGVKDGVITCVGRPNGYLATEKNYGNYKLSLDWRFVKAGNTGVLVHIIGQDKVWPCSIECQGMNKNQGFMYLWSGAKAKELLKGSEVKRTGEDNEKPVGEWNNYQVVCDKDTVTILVNGKVMNKITECFPNVGKIAIQCEGAQIEVKNIFIEPLDKKE